MYTYINIYICSTLILEHLWIWVVGIVDIADAHAVVLWYVEGLHGVTLCEAAYASLTDTCILQILRYVL